MFYHKADISKAVTWDGKTMSIPKKEVVEELAINAFKGDRNSMIELFRFYRYCTSPTTSEEHECMQTIIKRCDSLLA